MAANDPIADIGFRYDISRMIPRFLSLLAGVVTLVGCANPNAPITTNAANLTQEQVDALVERCGGTVRMAVIEQGTLTIRPPADFAVTGCVLKALDATGQTSLITVGN